MNKDEVASFFRSAKVLLMGDFMLDSYIFGRAERLSPEAPVPLLFVENESLKPGGGGNTILNLVSLGMEVYAMGRVGDDENGRHFLNLIKEPNVDTAHIFIDDTFKTPLKKRLIADNQQLLRVDYEKVLPLKPEVEEKAKKQMRMLIDKVDVVAISDYGKGFFTLSLLQYTISLAKEHAIPVIVDPKGSDFAKYKGATLIKPNLGEAFKASHFPSDTPLEKVATRLFELTAMDILMITRAKEGISLFWRTGDEAHFPAIVREVKDVTGAGDTVLAVMTAALANQNDMKKGALFANIAAGIAVGRVGCARISQTDILEYLDSRIKSYP